MATPAHCSRLRELEDILDTAVTEGVTPSYALVALRAGREVAALGALDTYFDIASVSKLYTAAAVWRQVAAGALDIEARLPGRSYRWRDLLDHTSGLAAWAPFYDILSPRAAIEATTPARAPGQRQIYSDIGYLQLGFALESRCGISLDELVSEEVTELLGLYRTTYWPYNGPPIAPTFRERSLGEVDDDNCFALGGVAGHAGLFATAHDVAAFGNHWLDALAGRSRWLISELAHRACYERPPIEGATFALGFDSKSPGYSSAGQRMSSRTVGHLGFTGCSLWIDPERELSVALLTNRVHPDRSEASKAGIRALRPRVHDALLDALDAAPT